MERPNTRETLKLAGLTALWIWLIKGIAWFGEHTLPDAWKAKISLHTFQMACQITAALVGVALSFALLAAPRAALALCRPRPRQLLATALIAPSFLVSTTVIALKVALPTLLEEVRTRGAGVSRQTAGEFGRLIEHAPLLVTLLWGAILAAVTEELAFRGALYSLVDRLIAAARPGYALRSSWSAPETPESTPLSQQGRPRVSLLGLMPSLVAAGVFGLMHTDLRGGVGIVRLVSSTLLGLGAGILRLWTGTLFAPILLHFLNNTMVIGHSRGWFGALSVEPTIIEGVPDAQLGLAAFGLVAAALMSVVLNLRDRRAQREQALSERVPPA